MTRMSALVIFRSGLNVQGSNDNFPYADVDGETRSDAEIARQRAEEVARNAADIEWLLCLAPRYRNGPIAERPDSLDKLCVAFPLLRPSEEGRCASANGRFKPI